MSGSFIRFLEKKGLLVYRKNMTDHVTLKTGVIAAKNLALPSQE